MGLSQRSSKAIKNIRKPVWKGPESESDEGGLTQSLIAKYIVCQERFRIHTIEGIQEKESFSVPLEYGNMWHLCEETWADSGDVEKLLKDYCTELTEKYPLSKSEISKWYSICKRQFPLYVSYWKDHADMKTKEPVLQEVSFKVPYKLPSGRTVILRGKWDSVDRVKRGRKKVIYLQENKAKDRIDEELLLKQLSFDLQTMTYYTALQEYSHQTGNEFVAGENIEGIRYNVIRRPGLVQRGGRMVNAKDKQGKSVKEADGTNKKVRQGEESNLQFADRVEKDIQERPDHYFMRWDVTVTQQDVEKFKRQFLNPCLEQICMWYDLQTGKDLDEIWSQEHFKFLHYRKPYGVYDQVSEGRWDNIDNYLQNGSMLGLQRVKTLFPELD